jgi:hypothetical protein
MDNQACRIIKNYFVSKQCNLMLVKPNNHQVNAAECAIQTFKAHFISALATTVSKFPLQLWDQLTNQAETTLNMLRPSRINPSMLAYKAIHGPYDWNRFPLAPPGCKAIIYKVPKTRGLWASHGTDAWYISPSMDHYRCNHYFVPETRAYRISGLAELFPQHCQVPFLMWNKHLQKVIDELNTTLQEMPPQKSARVIFLMQRKLRSANSNSKATRTLTNPNHDWMLPPGYLQRSPYIPPMEQRVEQRVAADTKRPPPVIQRITDAPPIMAAPNPTTKCILRLIKRRHMQRT